MRWCCAAIPLALGEAVPIIDTCWPKAEAAVVKPDQIQPNQANINKNDGGQGMLEREGEEGEREREGKW